MEEKQQPNSARNQWKCFNMPIIEDHIASHKVVTLKMSDVTTTVHRRDKLLIPASSHNL
jgi:hypothetical protein